jgi:drug/metabolite transporter (DMT)-like permease
VSNNNKQNLFAVFGLLFGALCWGVIWYPYRLINEAGVSGVVASFYTYLLALIIGGLYFWRKIQWQKGFHKRAFALCLVAGWTNLSYVLAVIDGEVMRVMLLFYLSPLWTLLLAHFWLKEKIHPMGYAAIVASLLGAFVMLNDFTHLSIPLPKNKAEWLALSSGIGFSLTNVITRRSDDLSLAVKSTLVWLGVMLVSLMTAWLFHYPLALPHHLNIGHGLIVGLIALLLVSATVLVQYGVTQLAATRASVLFLFELVVAAIAAYFLAHESMHWNEWIGGGLIIMAGLIAVRQSEQY